MGEGYIGNSSRHTTCSVECIHAENANRCTSLDFAMEFAPGGVGEGGLYVFLRIDTSTTVGGTVRNTTLASWGRGAKMGGVGADGEMRV